MMATIQKSTLILLLIGLNVGSVKNCLGKEEMEFFLLHIYF